MNTFYKYIYLLFLMVFISSCTGEYDEDISNIIQQKNAKKTVSIAGIITSDYKRQTIIVSRTVDLSELYLSSDISSKQIKNTLTHRRVGGAKVSVEVAGKKYEFKEMHKKGHLYGPQRENAWPEDIWYDEIYYESVDSFAGIPNQEHKLVVEVEGKTYIATDVMPQVSEISFTEKSPLCRIVEILGDEDHKVKLIHTGFPNYLFGQMESYIMQFNPIQIYTVEHGDFDKEFSRFIEAPCFSFRQLAVPQLMGNVGYEIVCPHDDAHLTDTIVVTKMSCSPSYEYFLYCLFLNKRGDDGEYDFGDISSNLPTNISNGGVGFFAACDVRRQVFSKRKLVQLAESIGNIIEY